MLYMYTAGWTTQSCEEIKIFESSKVCHAAAHKKKKTYFRSSMRKWMTALIVFHLQYYFLSVSHFCLSPERQQEEKKKEAFSFPCEFGCTFPNCRWQASGGDWDRERERCANVSNACIKLHCTSLVYKYQCKKYRSSPNTPPAAAAVIFFALLHLVMKNPLRQLNLS